MSSTSSYPESTELTTTSPLVPLPERLRVALDYASRGIPAFPTKPKDKRPITKHGHLDATTDHEQIKAWWTHWPDANIGIPTGERSDLLVIDVDPRHGGDESLDALEAKHGPLPRTRTIRTGRGGRHLYFRYPTGFDIRSDNSGKLGPGLDVKGEGGYIIAPPSRTTSAYKVLDKAPLADPPDYLPEMLRKPSRAADKPPAAAPGPPRSAPVLSGETIPEGGRNAALTRVAGRLRARCFDGPELLAELERINADQCTPPLPAPEVLKIARSAERWPAGNVSPGPSPEVLEALERIARDLLNYRAWPGVGGKTERSIVAALVVLARKHGQLCPAGIRVEVSFRDLALKAAVPLRTVTRAISRLKVMRGVLRADNLDRRQEEAGALVLLHPGASVHTPTTRSSPDGEPVVGGVDTLTTPRLRNSAPGILRLGKTSEALIDHLTASRTGTGEVPTLAALMGSDRPGSVRYLKRHVIPRLAEAEIVTLDGDTLALTADWHAALDRERERVGEIERYRLDVARYTREREAYARRHEYQPDPVPAPLEKHRSEPVRSTKEAVEKLEFSSHNTPETDTNIGVDLATRTGAELEEEAMELTDLGLEELVEEEAPRSSEPDRPAPGSYRSGAQPRKPTKKDFYRLPWPEYKALEEEWERGERGEAA